MELDFKTVFNGKHVLITGGLGFIGSNLAHKLVDLGAHVIIVDSLITGLGANKFNIEDIKDKIEIPNIEFGGVDLRNTSKMSKIIQGVDYVFNLAGSISHSGSKENPLRDLELNLESHLSFLEVCRRYMERENFKPNLKIVFAGTRDQYGKVREEFLPVNEKQLVHHAADPQGINKHAAEFYHLWYRNFGIKAVSLRMTNTYGPRQQMKDPGQGVLSWFIRKSMENEELQLWGGGESLRDFNYVDDVVDALLLVMASEKTDGEVYNLGSYIRKDGRYIDDCGNIITVGKVAQLVTEIAGSGSCKIIPYPDDKKDIEPGHFSSDITKIYKKLGWKPKVSLNEGIKRTLDYYRNYKEHYF
ncbi:GDP-mannose 4,6-dehydratase [archaeon]|nr:GDP-mannose 4,6-dehydratase [archaeon]